MGLSVWWMKWFTVRCPCSALPADPTCCVRAVCGHACASFGRHVAWHTRIGRRRAHVRVGEPVAVRMWPQVARAVALGYNVMAVDADVLVLDDFYFRVKQVGRRGSQLSVAVAQLCLAVRGTRAAC
jgi:hypothetical protein